MNLAQQLAQCTVKRQRIRKVGGGRPIDISSRRQRILAYLEESGPADNRMIAEVIGETIASVRSTAGDLSREGQLVRDGKTANRVIWKIAP